MLFRSLLHGAIRGYGLLSLDRKVEEFEVTIPGGVCVTARVKERALAHATASGIAPTRYKPPDPLLAFLESL